MHLLHRTGRTLGRVAREVLRAGAEGSARTTGSMRGHASHGRVVRRRGSRAVRGTDARVVLRTAPRQADARVTDGVPLHLVDCHLSSMAMHKLNEAATLARGDLDVGNLA